jgi:hypothetical protein
VEVFNRIGPRGAVFFLSLLLLEISKRPYSPHKLLIWLILVASTLPFVSLST